MDRDYIINEYFEWLTSFTKDRRHLRYFKLLSLLHSVEFIYSIPHDENRAVDGVNLRKKFAREYGYGNIMRYLNEPCSVLEMLVALSIRCEIDIMVDADIGDRTSEWFWIMLHNLGLEGMTDSKFKKDKVLDNLYIFLNREYEPNGEGGGLFIIDNPRRDLRDVEIWYQMCWYLNEL